MKFRTEISPVPSRLRLAPDSRVVMLGSCFTDNIGGRLADHGVRVSVNPCGVLYNPASIAAVITAAIDGDFPDTLSFSYMDMWRNWLFSTKFARAERSVAETVWRDSLDGLSAALREADMLILTFGTARVYSHLPTALSAYSGIVGNCHKVPAREFSCSLMTAEEIAGLWTLLSGKLRQLNPGLQIMYTVSPIRHFKDGAHANTLSKATLHLAVDQLCHAEATDYFPAYELLTDDLRDYRFYAADMLHPSDMAVEYIWRHFLAACFDESALPELRRRAALLRQSRHRPILLSD